MTIPIDIENQIKKTLLSSKGDNITLLDIQPISGGCINSASKIITNCGEFFLKWNQDSDSHMFEAESKGLELIRGSNTFYIPNVIAYNHTFLIIEFMENVSPTTILWQEFGRNLGELHKVSNSTFGLDHHNFIGSLIQKNNEKSDWADFFINQRIIPQLSISDFSTELKRRFEKLFIKIEDLFPNEPPSLLHGDLWNGNFMFLKNKVALFDPAVYFGFREMDIAMSKLFGGFHNHFYSAYNENYPLSEGWEERIDICNLYPLLVHVNLFGEGYYSQVKTILNRFV